MFKFLISLCLSLCIACNFINEDKNKENIDSDNIASVILIDTTIYNDRLPAISGRNHRGDSVDIRKIKAKIIMLEFWASWCPPCRKANPALVEVYKKYKNKGFEIVSISLDDKMTKWISAIGDDGLTWPYHLCDLQGWNSPWAMEYKIEQIPNNVLYNSAGQIIARSVDPEVLDKTLEQLFATK